MNDIITSCLSIIDDINSLCDCLIQLDEHICLLKVGATYTVQELYGDQYWQQLSPPDQSRAAHWVADQAKLGQLPVLEIDLADQPSRRYLLLGHPNDSWHAATRPCPEVD